METDNLKFKLPKRGIWGGYTIEKVRGPRGYYWIGKGDQYLMSITLKEARRLAKFLSK